MRFVQLAEQLGLPKIVSIQNSYSLLVRAGSLTPAVWVYCLLSCNFTFCSRLGWLFLRHISWAGEIWL